MQYMHLHAIRKVHQRESSFWKKANVYKIRKTVMVTAL